MVTSEQYHESVKLITNALNKSCMKGIFTLDEAYVIKTNIDKINEPSKYNYIMMKLNKSCKSGVFLLNEAYLIKIAMRHILEYNNIII